MKRYGMVARALPGKLDEYLFSYFRYVGRHGRPCVRGDVGMPGPVILPHGRSTPAVRPC